MSLQDQQNICCTDINNTCELIDCSTRNEELIDDAQETFISVEGDEEENRNICCQPRVGYCRGNTFSGICSDSTIETESDCTGAGKTWSSQEDINCEEVNRVPKSDMMAIKERSIEGCCDKKVGYCTGNTGDCNDPSIYIESECIAAGKVWNPNQLDYECITTNPNKLSVLSGSLDSGQNDENCCVEVDTCYSGNVDPTNDFVCPSNEETKWIKEGDSIQLRHPDRPDFADQPSEYQCPEGGCSESECCIPREGYCGGNKNGIGDIVVTTCTDANKDFAGIDVVKDDDEENCCIERNGYCFDNTNEEEDYQNNLCIDSDRLLTTDRTLRIDGATDEEKFRICCEEVTNRCTGNTDSTNDIICTSEQNPNGPQNNIADYCEDSDGVLLSNITEKSRCRDVEGIWIHQLKTGEQIDYNVCCENREGYCILNTNPSDDYVGCGLQIPITDETVKGDNKFICCEPKQGYCTDNTDETKDIECSRRDGQVLVYDSDNTECQEEECQEDCCVDREYCINDGEEVINCENDFPSNFSRLPGATYRMKERDDLPYEQDAKDIEIHIDPEGNNRLEFSTDDKWMKCCTADPPPGAPEPVVGSFTLTVEPGEEPDAQETCSSLAAELGVDENQIVCSINVIERFGNMEGLENYNIESIIEGMQNFQVDFQIIPTPDNPITVEQLNTKVEGGIELPMGTAVLNEPPKKEKSIKKYFKSIVIILIIIIALGFGAIKFL